MTKNGKGRRFQYQLETPHVITLRGIVFSKQHANAQRYLDFFAGAGIKLQQKEYEGETFYICLNPPESLARRFGAIFSKKRSAAKKPSNSEE